MRLWARAELACLRAVVTYVHGALIRLADGSAPLVVEALDERRKALLMRMDRIYLREREREAGVRRAP